jgi:hypothetical protein
MIIKKLHTHSHNKYKLLYSKLIQMAKNYKLNGNLSYLYKKKSHSYKKNAKVYKMIYPKVD